MKPQLLATLGAAALLFIIFGVPAVLVPFVMDDVPGRSMTRVRSVHQEAVNIVERTFAKHRTDDHPGRLSPLPRNSTEWIQLINPLGRKAPGGGLSIGLDANDATGTIGLRGDASQVVITTPSYRELNKYVTILNANPSLSTSGS